MDLKQCRDIVHTKEVAHDYPHGGFAGMSNRTGKQPIVVACNGHAHGSTPKQTFLSCHFLSASLCNGKVWLTFPTQGGGFEAILNADVIFASPNTTFALREVLRSVSALAGALPRAMLLFGNHRTMILIRTGRQKKR